MPEKYYGSVSELIDVTSIPGEFQGLESLAQDGVDILLGKISYKNFYTELSSRDAKQYYLVIVANTLRLPVFGTGLAIVFFKGSESTASEFPLMFEVRWPIRKYLANFNVQGFSYTPEALVEIFHEFTNTDERSFFAEVVSTFIDDGNDTYLTFFDNLKSNISDYSDSSPSVDAELININSQIDLIKAEVDLLITSSNQFTTRAIFDDFENNSIISGAVSSIDSSIELLKTDFDISINIKVDAVLAALVLFSNADEKIEKLLSLFGNWLSDITEEQIKDLLVPQFKVELTGIAMALELPRSILQPLIETSPGVWEVDETIVGSPPELIKAAVNFTTGPLRYDTQTGFEIEIDENLTIDLPRCRIGNTNLDVEFLKVKLDLSRKKNIPEAIADGRPEDFIGAYITEGNIYFPTFWNHNDGASTGIIKARNLLVGTGGLSGTLGLEAKTGVTTTPLISAKFGEDFVISLNAFDITFQQNAIIGSNIKGTMKIPGFKDTSGAQAIINIDVHIGTGGDFSVTASVNQTIAGIGIENIFELQISSLSVGRNDDKFFVAISGLLDFKPQGEIGKFLPDDIEIKKLIIYDDGTFEFEGGALVFPKAYTFKMGPVELSVTAIHLGTHEQEHNGNLRKYKYFGFDGGVSLNPGGVDARGKGIKFYFTVDNDLYGGITEAHFFFRIQSIAIDIIIPGNADPKDATLILKGYLAMQEPTIPDTATPEQKAILQNSTEYAGTVSFELPKLRGMAGSAAMRFNPDVPSFIVDIGVEIAQPIVLGATGLGIYGFRALVGRRYVTSKTYAGLSEDAEWWQYYKAKVDPDFKEGVQVSKFGPENGTAFGAGVSLATVPDSGKAFSSKLFLLLSLPDVLIFQGQAQILKERIGLDTIPDPPFFAFVAITSQSVEAAFGVNYKLPDDGNNPGKIVTVDGVTELGFFFGNSTAWYVNIGRETPENRRIQARVVDLFNMYFYLMLSSNGMRAGAGASWELNKKFGPLRAELGAYLDIAGRISRRPKQIGGSIQLGGNVGLYIFKFGFSFSVAAALAAESAKPRIVTGEFEVCIKVLKKKYCAHFELTWNYDNTLDTSTVPLIDSATIKDSGKSKHMITDDTLNLFATFHSGGVSGGYADIPHPNTWTGGVDKYIIPMDSMVDLEFKKGMDVNGTGFGLDKFGGATGGADNKEFVAPQRGKSDRVRHEYKLNSIEIVYYDANGTSGGNWQPFNFYDALTPQQDAAFVDQTALANMKYGFWQIDKPGNFNKLKILAQTPFSYLSPGTPLTPGDILPEDFGVTDDTIFCPEEPIGKTCINFNQQRQVPAIIPSDQYLFFQDILFQIVGQDGTIVANPYSTFPNALSIKAGDTLEIYFKEPVACVSILLQTMAVNVTVELYERVSTAPATINDLPSLSYNLIDSSVYPQGVLSSALEFDYVDYANKPIEKIIIKAGMCDPIPEGATLYCTADVTTEGKLLQNFLNTLLKNRHFLPGPSAVLLFPTYQREYDRIFFNTLLYSKPLQKNDTVLLTPTFVNNTTINLHITDEMGYNCNTTLHYPGSDVNFSFSNIVEFKNIRPNPAGMVEGDNYMFLVDVTVKTATGDFTFTLEGVSCYRMGECSRECSTFLYQFCYLPVEDALYNLTIPDASTVDANNGAMVDALTKTLQPVWRPNTIYAVRLSVTDSLYQEGGSSLLANYTNTFVYGFKTAGPVGHYHQYPTTSNTSVPKPEFTALKNMDREAEFKIHTLGLYIDYPKCFPNADSDLINAKPLYYKNPKFLIFYTKPYVYQFYNNWDQYGNAEAIESELEMLIKDPAEKPYVGTTPTTPLAGITSWITTQNFLSHDAQNIPQDMGILSNMIDNGNGCFSYPTPLIPIGIANEITCDDLLPLKLYTALFNGKYQRMVTDTTKFVREVHRYSFETSRYGNFTEHVNSYILKSHIDDLTSDLIIDKAAIYFHEQLISGADITVAQQFVINPNSVSDALIQEYAHPYDRIIDGILKVKQTLTIDAPPPNDLQTQPLPPAVTTEFNLIKNSDPSFNKLVGILVRSPEPFNDPKIPGAVLDTTILVEHTSTTSVVTTDYKLFFSKDNARVFITKQNGSLDMPDTGTYKITFSYKQFNGSVYATVGSPIDVLIEL
ncbi:MAG: hypothetical protein IPM74_03635 [Crocinitomicaceae bacterium]|nr:hypothetical protein [Crocinitomicaceae bacterium]MBK8925005.1 hypothetical protein [Crocinitomicaceae bacterium]